VKLQRRQHLFADLIRGQIFSVICDTQGGETKPGCGDAGDTTRIALSARGLVDRSIQHLSAGWIDLFGEVETGAALHVIQKCIVGIGKAVGFGDGLPDGSPRSDEWRRAGEPCEQNSTDHLRGISSRKLLGTWWGLADRTFHQVLFVLILACDLPIYRMYNTVNCVFSERWAVKSYAVS
jgi:hypothetical protein